MSYAMRLTWPDIPGRPDDFVFRHSSVDVGRCYRRLMARNQPSRRVFAQGFVNRLLRALDNLHFHLRRALALSRIVHDGGRLHGSEQLIVMNIMSLNFGHNDTVGRPAILKKVPGREDRSRGFEAGRLLGG